MNNEYSPPGSRSSNVSSLESYHCCLPSFFRFSWPVFCPWLLLFAGMWLRNGLQAASLFFPVFSAFDPRDGWCCNRLSSDFPSFLPYRWLLSFQLSNSLFHDFQLLVTAFLSSIKQGAWRICIELLVSERYSYFCGCLAKNPEELYN